MDRDRADGLYRGYCEGTTPESSRVRAGWDIEECRLAVRRRFCLYGAEDL